MKNICLIFSIQFMVVVASYAVEVPAKIIYNSMQHSVVLQLPTNHMSASLNLATLNNRVIFTTTKGLKVSVAPSEVEQIEFVYKNEEHKLRRIKNFFEPKLSALLRPYVFIKVECEGDVKLYSYFVSKNSTRNPREPFNQRKSSIKKYALQRHNEKLVKIKTVGFKKHMIEYLSDCSELVCLLRTNELKETDLKKMVEAYNQQCNEPDVQNDPLR